VTVKKKKAAMKRSVSVFRNDCLESVHQTAVKIHDDDGDSCIWISFDAKADVLGRYNANLIAVMQDKYGKSAAKFTFYIVGSFRTRAQNLLIYLTQDYKC
jgi:hypothetical protein